MHLILYSDSVKILKGPANDGGQAVTIGKGIFLSMNSEGLEYVMYM